MNADIQLDELFDLVIGIGPDGGVASPREMTAASDALARAGHSANEIDDFRSHRETEIIRDDVRRIRGCSYPGCTRAAVWQRMFECSVSAQQLLVGAAMLGGAASLATTGMGLFVKPHQTDFERQRLGFEKRDDLKVALQFGCWNHIAGFVSIPSSGQHCYVIREAMLPTLPPLPIFSISAEQWSWLKIAEDAQNIGTAEGPLGFCEACGLPHDPFSGKGIEPGEGDEFWRTFCAYCETEIKPDSAES